MPNEALFAEAAFDLAFVAGDNRYAWLAAAMHARWIVAFGGRPPRRARTGRSTSCAAIPTFPPPGATWLPRCSTGRRLRLSRPATGPRRPRSRFALRRRSPTRCCTSAPARRSSMWPPDAGQRSRRRLAARGIKPVWSAGRGEEAIVAACDPGRRYASFAGRWTCRSCGTCSPTRGCWSRPTPASRTSRARRRADGRTVRSRFGGHQRRRRLLARLPLSRRDDRSFPVPRPARAVPARNRLGAPLRPRRRMPAAVHGRDRRRNRPACDRFDAGATMNPLKTSRRAR